MKETIRAIRHAAPNGVERVCLLVNGQLVADLPAEVAERFGREMVSMARLIMNDANPQKAIADQAVFMRAGVPLGLTDNPKILAEAHKEAQYNRDLRRYMKRAPGISSREVVGIPTITTGAPPNV